MKVMVLDCGNSQIKAKTATQELCFPSLFAEISESKYNETLQMFGKNVPSDYFSLVLGYETRYFVVGESAALLGPTPAARGADKYRYEYFSVFVAAALSQMYKTNSDVSLMLSYPPGDVRYVDDMIQAAKHDYPMTQGNKTPFYNVTHVEAFDEPSGGLMNVLLTEDGTDYKTPALAGQRVLVIDVGGGTTDFIQLREDHTIDYGSAHSEHIGVIEIMQQFETDLKAANRNAFKSAYRIPQDRIRDAIRTGIYRGGGYEIDCTLESANARNRIGTNILQIIQNRYGGGMNFDAVLFTGGGSALLFDDLAERIGNREVHLADDIESLHMANVRGGMKLWRMFQALEQ